MDPTPKPEEIAAQNEQPKTKEEIDAQDIAQQKARYEVEKLQKEIKKIERETEKVELDLRDLRPQWWRRPLVLAAFLPSILAIGSLIYASSNGWFQVVTKDLANQRWDLKQDVNSLKRDKSSLEQDKRTLSSERAAMQKRLNKDLAKVALERTSMQERLSTERAANEYRINFERSKAGQLVAAARTQARQEKRRLEELARKVSFETLFKASERDIRTIHMPIKPGVVHTFTDDFREPNAATAASYVMVSILKKRDKRAEELRTILASKVGIDSHLDEEVTGMYLYTLYKGTGDTTWKAQFIAKAQIVADRLRSQSADSDDDNISESDYFKLFNLPDWSAKDQDDIALFLASYIQQLSGQPGKQSDALYLFAKTLNSNAWEFGLSFCRNHPKDFVYMLQLARNEILKPSNFSLKENADFDSERLNGPELWLSTFAPAVMVMLIAHIAVTQPIYLPANEDDINTKYIMHNMLTMNRMFRNTADGMSKSLGIEAIRNLPYYNFSKPNIEEWRSWNAAHPHLALWLTPDLSAQASVPGKFFIELWSINDPKTTE